MAVSALKPNPAMDALSARLSGQVMPKSGAWAKAARADALARLSATGLPARRDEYWLFTRPDTLNQPVPKPAAPFDHSDEDPIFSKVDRVRLIFTDGVFDQAASDDPALAGVEISRLADGGQTDVHWAADLYGVLETRGQKPVARPLATLSNSPLIKKVV